MGGVMWESMRRFLEGLREGRRQTGDGRGGIGGRGMMRKRVRQADGDDGRLMERRAV